MLEDSMNIGIIGSGSVGQTLAKGFVKHGYTVMIGTREPSKLSEWKKREGNGVAIGNFAETALFGSLLVLAVKGTAAKDALNLAGPEHLEGKIVIDATNPIADAPPTHGVLQFFTSLDNSLMEQLQAEFPNAHFVKAFNSIGGAYMVNPDFKGIKPTMFICGNNEHAKKEVSTLLNVFGFDVEDLGRVEAARAIEPLCMLWCIPGFLHNQWAHAFKLLKT